MLFIACGQSTSVHHYSIRERTFQAPLNIMLLSRKTLRFRDFSGPLINEAFRKAATLCHLNDDTLNISPSTLKPRCIDSEHNSFRVRSKKRIQAHEDEVEGNRSPRSTASLQVSIWPSQPCLWMMPT